MAIQSQRLFIIFFMTSLLIGLVNTIYMNPTSWDGSVSVTTGTDSMNNLENIVGSEDTLYDGINTGNQLSETTVGNPISWTRMLWDIIKYAFNPFSISMDQDTDIESIGAIALGVIRSILTIFVIMELWFLFKSKKYS